MVEQWGSPDVITWVLRNCQTWAVVGLADNPARPAHHVAEFLQRHGKRIVPVHPRAETVWGEPGYPTLADVPFPIDCVDVFRRADRAGRFADEAVAVRAKAVWFQLGVVDKEAYRRVSATGLRMVMDRCPVIEWREPG
jgi:hypothetical protein